MTKLNKLPKTTTKPKKRVGRGYGSGKGGHTVGRGAKGQKARSKVKLGFEGAKTKKSLLKRLPLLRGKGKLKSREPKPVIVNLKYLNVLPKDTKVTLESLDKHGVISQVEGKRFGVKILGEGKIEKALTVNLPVSQGAKKKIEKAGGKVVVNGQRKRTS
jgi:large subunit ribosomal protein L15